MNEALSAARAEAARSPTDVDAHERYIDIMLSVGLPSVVLPRYRERAERRAADADAQYLLGRALTDPAASQRQYLIAIQLNPRHARAMTGLATSLRAQGRLPEADAMFRKALEIDDQQPEAWAGLSSTLLIGGYTDDALMVAHQAMARVPADGDAYIAVAALAPQEARKVLGLAVSRVVGDPRLHALYADVLLEVGKADEALRQANLALAISPNHQQARLTAMLADNVTRGRIDRVGYQQLRDANATAETRPGDALGLFDALVAKYGGSELVFMGRARVHSLGGHAQLAQRDLERAVEIAPENPETQAGLGLILARQGKHAEALPYLQMAHGERPDDLSLVRAYARSRAETGDLAGARRSLARAHTEHPRDLAVLLQYAELVSRTDPEGAYGMLRAAVETHADPRILIALAAAARDVGKHDEAATIMERLAKLLNSEAVAEAARKLRAEAAAKP